MFMMSFCQKFVFRCFESVFGEGRGSTYQNYKNKIHRMNEIIKDFTKTLQKETDEQMTQSKQSMKLHFFSFCEKHEKEAVA